MSWVKGYRKMNIKKLWMKKFLMTLGFVCVMTSMNELEITAKEKAKMEISFENFDNVEEIISKYHLENKAELILQNRENFLKLYKVIKSNPFYKEKDIEVALNDFDYLNKYCDFENILNRLKERIILTDNEFCLAENTDGYHNYKANKTILVENVTDYVRDHENMHCYFTHGTNGEKEFLYLQDGKVVTKDEEYEQIISNSGIQEAFASDLASQNYSKNGFAYEYLELNQILQAFYEIYGREDVLKNYQDEDFLANTYQYYLGLGFSKNSIIAFFQNTEELKIIYDQEKKRTLTEEEKENKDEILLEVINGIAKIYEVEKQAKWQDSFQMQGIIYSILKKVDIEHIKDENLKNWYQNPAFLTDYYIDITNAIETKVVIESQNSNWSGEFCFSYKATPVFEVTEPDTFLYIFNEEKVVNACSFNEEREKRIDVIKSYGITEEETINICVESPIFTVYENLILNTEILNFQEKKYMLTHFKDFANLHPNYFKISPSSDIMQILLSKTMKNCQTKEDFYQILMNENTIYNIGGKDYQQELSSYGIVDFESQKYYIQNYIIFEGFKEGLKNNSFMHLTEEERREAILKFPNFVLNNPTLMNLKEEDCYEYVKLLISNTSKEGLEELLKEHIILKPKPIETKERKIVYAYV